MITTEIKNIPFSFETNDLCFSPKNIDKGTLAMLSCVDFRNKEKILDLGCGYGIVGIVATKFMLSAGVYMTDIDENALACAEKNVKLNNSEGIHIILSDAYKSLEQTQFDIILSNPPYHADFSVPKMFIEKGFNRLKIGGTFFMVTKRKEWYKNKFTSIFGGVKIYEIDDYFVFEAEKREQHYKKKL